VARAKAGEASFASISVALTTAFARLGILDAGN
jgi:hypothetical protein